jgi:hypothetical protein
VTEKLLQYVCPNCGAAAVKCDYFSTWDVEGQRWETESTYDNAWCSDCDKDVRFLEGVEVKNVVGVVSIDLEADDQTVLLETGEKVPITVVFANTVVAGPTKDGQWIATAIIPEDREGA